MLLMEGRVLKNHELHSLVSAIKIPSNIYQCSNKCVFSN